MKPLQGQNLDLLAMLSGKATGKQGSGKASIKASRNQGAKNIAGKVEGGDADLLAMLGGSSKAVKTSSPGKGEFAEILSQKGMLEDISSEDLINFFKKSKSTGSEPVAQLLQKYSDLTGKSIDMDALPDEIMSELQELSFDGSEFSKSDGEVIPKNKVLKLLTGIQEKNTDSSGVEVKNFKDIQTINSKRLAEIPNKHSTQKIDKKSLLGKSNASDFVDQKMVINKKNNYLTSSKAQKGNIALIQYNKENRKLNKSLIGPINRVDEMGNISSIGRQSNFESKDKVESNTQGPIEISSIDTLGLSDLKSHDTGEQGFQMNKGQKTQVLDLSNISANNKIELMQKVGNYIEQSYVSGKGPVDMVVNHEELGQFRVQAHKVGSNGQINLEINTITDKGQQFFADNEVELLKTLNKSGIKLNDFKITPQSDFLSLGDTSKSSMNSDSSSSSSFFGGGDRGEASAFTQGGRQGDNRGEDRRRQLWQEAKSFSEQMYA